MLDDPIEASQLLDAEISENEAQWIAGFHDGIRNFYGFHSLQQSIAAVEEDAQEVESFAQRQNAVHRSEGQWEEFDSDGKICSTLLPNTRLPIELLGKIVVGNAEGEFIDDQDNLVNPAVRYKGKIIRIFAAPFSDGHHFFFAELYTLDAKVWTRVDMTLQVGAVSTYSV